MIAMLDRLTKIKARAHNVTHSGPLLERGAVMELLLFVSQAFAPCREAERVWQSVAAESGCSLTVVDINSPEGHELAESLRVTVVPAVATEGRLLAIGVQSADEARKLVGQRHDSPSPG